ncbi:MAG: ABC transporter ATP-binding protein [Eubacteriales bacterium]|nr:ABC transporter ATP-binding protein [Eubacteriales bacterium]
MLIEMTGIKKSFRNTINGKSIEVLKGIDLTVAKGEMLAIKGSSGAGKSTLLHIIGCLDKASEGEYMLEGENVSNLSSKKLALLRNSKIGFVMQHFALIEEDSVLKNVGAPLLFSKTKLSHIDFKAQEQLDKLGILKLAKQKAGKLSGGEKQRVAIARALVNQPDIILADEPTGSLDRKNAMTVMDIFSQLHAEGKTIIIVTHEDFVASLCDRTLTILDGQIS